MKNSTNTLKAFVASLLLISSPVSYAEDDAPLTVDVSRITMDVANTIALATIASCRGLGYPVSVTVVDRNGLVQVQLRDTMAPPVSLSISRKKAYTSVMFNAKGSDLKRMQGNPIANGEDLVFSGGSVPIKAAGKLYGAIGVSGAPGGDLDEGCAIAGLEAVSDDLEMQ